MHTHIKDNYSWARAHDVGKIVACGGKAQVSAGVCDPQRGFAQRQDDAPLSVVGSVVHDSKGQLLNAEASACSVADGRLEKAVCPSQCTSFGAARLRGPGMPVHKARGLRGG